jgi:hypothetical protein
MEKVALLLFVLPIIFAVGVMWYSRAKNILRHWAQNNDYEILSRQYRWIRRGPFFWWTTRGQEVFYVTIRTPDGQLKRGWVRCGNWFWGILQDQADVRWDE